MRKDKVIECVQCGQKFVWTQGEQEFYKEKGLRPPSRCPICRATFKAAKEDNFRGEIKKAAPNRQAGNCHQGHSLTAKS